MAEKEEKEIGKISHFFSKIGVGVVELTDTLRVGDEIRIKGHTTDFCQLVQSMQIEHTTVKEAPAGKSVGIKVTELVRPHDTVFKISAPAP